MATAPRRTDADAAPERARGWDAPALREITADGTRLLVTPIGPGEVAKTSLNTPRDTWRWLWKDTLTRVGPFLLVAGLWARFSREGVGALGLRRDGWLGDTLLGLAIGIPFAQIAAVFRRWVAPGYRLPTRSDHTLQTVYYFALNAPAEEFVWRGIVQTLVIRGLRRVPRLRRIAGPLGWAGVAAGFGAFHRLGGWNWRSIAGVTFAGGLFGALFALPKRKSILPAIIAHGFATAGFLNWGDVALHAHRMRRLRHRPA
ncbi:MAG: CPBP family intramembrane glutamic endopeptidase [Ktedonobacterales bacterium]|jgi:hypothetical protein